MGTTNRKFGRNKRAPCNKYYTSSRKWETNKKRKIAKHKIKLERDAKKPARMKVPRGTARAKKRANLSLAA